MMSAAENFMAAVRHQMRASGIPDTPTVAPFRVGAVSLFLRTLSAERLAAILLWRKQNPGDDLGLVSHMLAASLCDAEGGLLYRPDEVRHRLSDRVAEVVTNEVLRRHGMA